MKQTIVTTNEFVYDVLNNMIHHNEIVLSKKDIADSKSLRYMLGRLKTTFKSSDDGEFLTLTKVRKLDANIKFCKTK